MKIYLKNIERLDHFYQSDYYRYLDNNDQEMVKSVENALYIDPDVYDNDLYKELAHKYNFKYNLGGQKCKLFTNVNNHEIKMSADSICGWKNLQILESTWQKFLSNYAKVRSTVKLHFIWPQHRLPTINTQRYIIYHDRIDYLLYDLKCYFEGSETPMLPAYKNNNTKIWLDKFAGSFPDFIDEMRFESFVNKNYDVLDIENRQRKIVTGDLNELHKKSLDKDVQKRYLQELLALDNLFN